MILKSWARLILFMCEFITEWRAQTLIYSIFIKNTNVLLLLALFLATALQIIKLQNSETTRPQVLQMLENFYLKFFWATNRTMAMHCWTAKKLYCCNSRQYPHSYGTVKFRNKDNKNSKKLQAQSMTVRFVKECVKLDKTFKWRSKLTACSN